MTPQDHRRIRIKHYIKERIADVFEPTPGMLDDPKAARLCVEKALGRLMDEGVIQYGPMPAVRLWLNPATGTVDIELKPFPRALIVPGHFGPP